jgi:hypothetical protein
MWAENTAGRGSIEIASCIFKHIGTQLSLNPDITSIKMMSDSCGGQNRNNYSTVQIIRNTGFFMIF